MVYAVYFYPVRTPSINTTTLPVCIWQMRVKWEKHMLYIVQLFDTHCTQHPVSCRGWIRTDPTQSQMPSEHAPPSPPPPPPLPQATNQPSKPFFPNFHPRETFGPSEEIVAKLTLAGLLEVKHPQGYLLGWNGWNNTPFFWSIIHVRYEHVCTNLLAAQNMVLIQVTWETTGEEQENRWVGCSEA